MEVLKKFWEWYQDVDEYDGGKRFLAIWLRVAIAIAAMFLCIMAMGVLVCLINIIIPIKYMVGLAVFLIGTAFIALMIWADD